MENPVFTLDHRILFSLFATATTIYLLASYLLPFLTQPPLKQINYKDYRTFDRCYRVTNPDFEESSFPLRGYLDLDGMRKQKMELEVCAAKEV